MLFSPILNPPIKQKTWMTPSTLPNTDLDGPIHHILDDLIQSHLDAQPNAPLYTQFQKTKLPLGLQLTLLKPRGTCVQSVLCRPEVHLSVDDLA